MARLPAAAFSEMRVAFTEAAAAAAAGSRPARHKGDASPLAQVLISTSSSEAGAAEPRRAAPHRTPRQESWWLLTVSKLQIHLPEMDPAQCQKTDKAYAKSQPPERIKQLLEEKQ